MLKCKFVFLCFITQIQLLTRIFAKPSITPLSRLRFKLGEESAGGFLGFQGVEEPTTLEECLDLLNIIAIHYLELPDARKVLIDVVNQPHTEESFKNCENTLVKVALYLNPMHRTMKYMELVDIPTTCTQWNEATYAIEKFCVPNCRDKEKEELRSVLQNDSLKTPNDFFVAFYNASKICNGIPKNAINYKLRKLGYDPNKYSTEQKLVCHLVDDLCTAKLDAKIDKAFYYYRSLIEDRQEKWAPPWLSELKELSIQTVWRIIADQIDKPEILIFYNRMKQGCGIEIRPDEFVKYILSERRKACPDVHANEFPPIENDDEWNRLFKKMGIEESFVDQCLVRSFAESIKTRSEYKSVSTQSGDLYLHLQNLPIGYYSEEKLRRTLEGLVRPGHCDGTILKVYILIAKRGNQFGEAIIFYKDETSRNLAYQKLTGTTLLLPSEDEMKEHPNYKRRLIRVRKLSNGIKVDSRPTSQATV